MTNVRYISHFYGWSYLNLNFIKIWLENFFERYPWFKFNNLELGLGMALKFCTNVEKELKIKVKKLLGLISTLLEVTGERLVAGHFPPMNFWTFVEKEQCRFFLIIFSINISFFFYYTIKRILLNILKFLKEKFSQSHEMAKSLSESVGVL